MYINIYIPVLYIYIIHIPDAETEYVCGMKTEDDLSNI